MTSQGHICISGQHQPGSCNPNGSNILLITWLNPWRKHQIFTFSFWGKAVKRLKHRVRRNALSSIFGPSSNAMEEGCPFISCKGTHALAGGTSSSFQTFHYYYWPNSVQQCVSSMHTISSQGRYTPYKPEERALKVIPFPAADSVNLSIHKEERTVCLLGKLK